MFSFDDAIIQARNILINWLIKAMFIDELKQNMSYNSYIFARAKVG